MYVGLTNLNQICFSFYILYFHHLIANSNNLFLPSQNKYYENINKPIQGRMGSMMRGNESNNVRSIITDSVRNSGNNINNPNTNTNSISNNRALRSLSTNNQYNLNRRNTENNSNRYNNQIRNSDNSLIYQDYGLFPFINEGINSDIGI